MVFRAWLVKIRTDFGSAQNSQLLDGFPERTELLRLAGVDYLVLVDQKRERCSCAGSCFALCPSELAPVERFFICSLEIGLLPFPMESSAPAMLPVFMRFLASAPLLYLPHKSVVRDNAKRFVERQ